MNSFCCSCLNVTIVAPNGSGADPQNAANHIKKGLVLSGTEAGSFEHLEFLKSALGPYVANVIVQCESLVSSIKVDKWTITHCLNCDSYCFATAAGGSDNKKQLWVNGDLLTDQAQLHSLMKCDKYSMPFKIIVKSVDGFTRSRNSRITDDPRFKSLYAQLQNFIATDATKTEAEIRRLTQQMNQRRQKAEKDFESVAAIIEATSSTSSTKMLSNDNIESLTPPVTPESVNDKMAIDDHPLLSQGKMDPNAKHLNAIQSQHIARTIDFEDDIFDMDGMQSSGAVNDADRYHKYSDTEDASDGERIVDKRPLIRGRSGSINIARSAPMPMPQFNVAHPMHPDDDDFDDDDDVIKVRPDPPQQMDIASSIKMIARSVHADSIFGELPAAPRLRYDTEF